MCEYGQYISLGLIRKLSKYLPLILFVLLYNSYLISGHKIAEIRERALFAVASKLENGFTFENELSGTRELLSYLFNWFLFEPCSQEQVVLGLIDTVLQVSKLFYNFALEFMRLV